MTTSWDRSRRAHRSRQAASIASAALALMTDHGASALTIAGVADAAEVSRQTVYRYYADIDAVLVGVAELVTSHDAAFERAVHDEPDPWSRLELIARTTASSAHGPEATATLAAALPPQAREILDAHEGRIRTLLADVLRAGVDDGSFRPDLAPDDDARLILGLLTAAQPADVERALTHVQRLVTSTEQTP